MKKLKEWFKDNPWFMSIILIAIFYILCIYSISAGVFNYLDNDIIVICIDGVEYVRGFGFVSVKLDRDGNVSLCE